MSPTELPVRYRLATVEHRSDLGSWREIFCVPPSAIAPFVEMMWFGEGSTSYLTQRILPRGSAHLLINLGPEQAVLDSAHGVRQHFRETSLSGARSTYLDVEAPGGVRMMGVAFHSIGARSILGGQADLADRLVDLTDALGDGERALRERLGNCRTMARRFELLEAWLARRLASGRQPHPIARWLEGRLEQSAGTVRIRDLARESGFSRKHLVELARQEIGLTPKRVARLYRFHRAMEKARAHERPDWARLAVESGYYDQSHLARDFRAFSGFSPTGFMKARVVDDFTLALE